MPWMFTPKLSYREAAEGCFVSHNLSIRLSLLDFQHRHKQKQGPTAAAPLWVPQQLEANAQLAEAESLALATP